VPGRRRDGDEPRGSSGGGDAFVLRPPPRSRMLAAATRGARVGPASPHAHAARAGAGPRVAAAASPAAEAAAGRRVGFALGPEPAAAAHQAAQLCSAPASDLLASSARPQLAVAQSRRRSVEEALLSLNSMRSVQAQQLQAELAREQLWRLPSGEHRSGASTSTASTHPDSTKSEFAAGGSAMGSAHTGTESTLQKPLSPRDGASASRKVDVQNSDAAAGSGEAPSAGHPDSFSAEHEWRRSDAPLGHVAPHPRSAPPSPVLRTLLSSFLGGAVQSASPSADRADVSPAAADAPSCALARAVTITTEEGARLRGTARALIKPDVAQMGETFHRRGQFDARSYSSKVRCAVL
jgi:hypothetical protein